jgi:hypothetical protein
MRYFLDTEFLEGKQKTLFGNTKPTIDLVSIGIVSEDGREYYAISKDFNLKEAWNRYQMKQVYGDARNLYPEGIKEYWIRDNVLKPIFFELSEKDGIFANGEFDYFTYSNFKDLINKYGKSNKQIAEEIKKFIYSNINNSSQRRNPNTTHEFYGYYCDYDWVVFCWLFGKMIDLPKGFPMYCIDLKQELDKKAVNGLIPYTNNGQVFTWTLSNISNFPNYPKQTNEHNALADARWNYELYKFLQKI